MQRGDTKYTALDGTPALKEGDPNQVSAARTSFHFDADEITVATGAKQILFNAMMATVDPGDEVIIPTPYWTLLFRHRRRSVEASPCWLPAMRTAGFG